MDQSPLSGAGLNHGNLFADSQQYNHTYDNLFPSGVDPNFNDASWGVNASAYPPIASRGQPAAAPPSWQPNANRLSTTAAHANLHGQASPYAARSLSQSPATFGQDAFGSYGNPSSYQYREQPQYDPALLNPTNHGQEYGFDYVDYRTPQEQCATIAPHALEHERQTPSISGSIENNSGHLRNQWGIAKGPSSDYVDHSALVSAIPKGTGTGMHSIIDFDQLVRATDSDRMVNYLNIGRQEYDWPVNRTATLPQYVPRKSKNELRKLAGNDSTLLAKLGKKSVKKERDLTIIRSDIRPFTARTAAPGPTQTMYDRESSSDDEASDADDDSSYTSGEDLEGSPLPDKRPETPKEAVEYDTIKALWRSKRKSVDAVEVKKALIDFWDVVKTIRDRWKIDSDAVKAAEESNKAGELQLLRSRVKDQRDMIETAFKVALKHGHRSIVELLAENVPLVFLCYQFLLDRFKHEDVNGSLSRVILETMTLFTTLSNEKLEKTHLLKVLPRFIKNGDAKTQYYAKRITSNSAAAAKGTSTNATTNKTISLAATSPARKPSVSGPVAGVKRAASSAGEGGAQKKVATTAAKISGTSAVLNPNGALRKPTVTVEPIKASTTTPGALVTKTKQVTAKPSGFFSSLQSASKKPGTSIKAGQPAQGSAPKPTEKKLTTTPAAGATNATPKSGFSFAETMANLTKPKEERTAPKQEKELPPETAEEKAKRVRKEARRKLHVSFKPTEDLEEIHYFTHHPDEEIDHDSSQMRDVADIAGEGRMLKQHRDMMDIDEEEETSGEEVKLIKFNPPTLIDFSDVDPEERKRNYASFGGGEVQVDSPERLERERYEANTLIVFYANASDIPPNPREPADPYNGDPSVPLTLFGAPEQKFAERARQKTSARQTLPPSASTVPPSSAISSLAQFASQHQQAPTDMLAPPQTNPGFDIQKILASLPQSATVQPQQQPQAPPIVGYGIPSAPPPANASGAAPQPFGEQSGQSLDLSSILASIQPQQPGAPQMGGDVGAPAAPPMFGYTPQMEQQNAAESAERKRWRDQGQKNKFYKTKVCKYWQEGRCMKGDDCTYLHEEPAS